VPANPPLEDDERAVLDVLMQHDRRVADRTVEKIADAVGMTYTPTYAALRKLETRRPQLAHPDRDATLEFTFWRTTHDAADAVEDG
jgi:hypothetical protein